MEALKPPKGSSSGGGGGEAEVGCCVLQGLFIRHQAKVTPYSPLTRLTTPLPALQPPYPPYLTTALNPP